MAKVNLIIDGISVQANDTDTILLAAKEAGIKIPTLCYLKDVSNDGACRVCVVDVVGQKNLVTSCNNIVKEGMEISTSNEKVLKARKKNVELLLSNHDNNCLTCAKSLSCNLQKLSYEFGCNQDEYKGERNIYDIDDSSNCIVRDNNKCILCGRCVAMCKDIQATSAYAKINRGFETIVACAFDQPISDSTCVGCGQCVIVCPTGALLETSNIKKVLNFFKDPENVVIAQVAPAVRVAINEEFGKPMGTFNEGQIATALKRLGFHKVFDVNVGADFTVIEESTELLERINKNENLPLMSSCCPAWVNYIETFYPDYYKNLSTCKSPNEMLGSVIKSYYAKANNINPQKIKVVAVMPCTAKKQEITRATDVDAVLTTRELATLIKYKNIDFNNLPESDFDSPLGEYSGAGLIFGVTGGVTEAVLRTAADKITGKDNQNIDFEIVRQSEGVKETCLDVGDVKLNICVVHGLRNAHNIMEKVENGEKHFHFIEFMACPGGCVNGGGQPFVDYDIIDYNDVAKTRAKALYEADAKLKNRKSHKNIFVNEIYEKFLIPEKLSKTLLHYHKKEGK